MLRYLIAAAACTALLFSPVAGSQTGDHVKVALLPVRQTRIPDAPGTLDEKLATAIHVEFTRMADFELIEFAQLQEQWEDQLVNDAIFELLVTNDLTQTFQVLEAFDTDAGRRRLYGETAKRLGIDYLAEVTLEGSRWRTEINYRLADTETNRVALAESFTHSPNESRGVARETAKRLTRDLWRLTHTDN